MIGPGTMRDVSGWDHATRTATQRDKFSPAVPEWAHRADSDADANATDLQGQNMCGRSSAQFTACNAAPPALFDRARPCGDGPKEPEHMECR